MPAVRGYGRRASVAVCPPVQVALGLHHAAHASHASHASHAAHAAAHATHSARGHAAAAGLLYFTSGFRGSALLAIDYKKAEGDITGSETVVWTYEGEGTPYVPSPLLSNDVLYFLNKNKGMLSCVDAKTGSPHYTNQRLEGLQGVYASPVAAKGRVYIAGRSGRTVVLEDGPAFKVLAESDLDDSFTASPAIVGSQLFLRGLKNLYCLQVQ